MSDRNKIEIDVGIKSRQGLDDIYQGIKKIGDAVKELAKTIADANQQLQNLGKATGASASFTGGKDGLPKPPPTPTGGSSGGGLGGINVGTGIEGTSASFKNAAISVKTFNDSLKDSVASIHVASNSLNNLIEATNKLNRAKTELATKDASYMPVRSIFGDLGGVPQNLRPGATIFGQMPMDPTLTAPHPSDFVEKKRTWWNTTGWGGEGLSGVGTGYRNMVLGAADRLGISGAGVTGLANIAGVAGLGMTVGAAAWGAANWVSQGYKDARQIQLDQVMNEPGRRYSRAAAITSPSLAAFGEAFSFDAASMLARRKVTSDRAFMDSLVNQEAISEFVGMQYGRTGTLNDAVTTFIKEKQQNIGLAAQDFLSGKGIGGDINAMAAQLETAFADFSASRVAKINEATAQRRAINSPLFNQLAGMFPGQVMGRAATSRATGFRHGIYDRLTGGLTIAKKDEGHKFLEKTLGVVSNTIIPETVKADRFMDFVSDQLTPWGISQEEWAGAEARIRHGAGVGYQRYFGGKGLISMEAGGFRNVTEILRGMGSMMGTAKGGANFLTGTLQRMSGAGGLDPTVSSDLAMAVLGATQGGVLRGTSMINNLAMAAGGLVYSGGGDVGAQQLRQEMLNRGFQTSQKFGEAGSPLQRWLSYSTAMSSLGATVGAENLLGMSTGELTALARSKDKDLSYAQKALGLTPEAARRQLESMSAYSLVAVNPNKLGTEESRKLYKLAEEKGGVIKAVESEIAGLKGREREKRILDLAQAYGGITGPSQGMTAGESADAYMAMFAGSEQISPFLKKGRGAGMKKPGGADAEYLEGQAQLGKAMSEMVEVLTGFYGKAADSALKEDKNVQRTGEAALKTPAGGIMGAASDAVNSFRTAIELADDSIRTTYRLPPRKAQ